MLFGNILVFVGSMLGLFNLYLFCRLLAYLEENS